MTWEERQEVFKARDEERSNSQNNSQNNPQTINQAQVDPQTTPAVTIAANQAQAQPGTIQIQPPAIQFQPVTEQATPAAQNQVNARGHVMRAFMSNNQANQAQNPSTNSTVTFNGVTYHACQTKVHYKVRQGNYATEKTGLVDHGANGGLWGAGGKILAVSETAKADVTGILQDTYEDVPIASIAAKINTKKGPVIGIFHQYALIGEGATIHSSIQLESFDVKVQDQIKCLGGQQRIVTPEGNDMPLSVKDGLVYLDWQTPTDAEFDELPHVTMTSDVPWDPTIFDSEPEAETFDEYLQEDPELEDLPELAPRNYDSDDDDSEVEADDEYQEDFTPHELNLQACIIDTHAETAQEN